MTHDDDDTPALVPIASQGRLWLEMWVPGIPAPQGSKRHVGGGRMVESSARLRPWRAAITTAAVMAAGPDWQPIDQAAHVILDFRLPRPASHYGTGRNARRLRPSAPRYHTQRPDVDKMARAALDALTDAGLWRSDAQAYKVWAFKDWTERTPGCGIRVLWWQP